MRKRSPINMHKFFGIGRHKFYRFVHSLRSSFPSDLVTISIQDDDGDDVVDCVSAAGHLNNLPSYKYDNTNLLLCIYL